MPPDQAKRTWRLKFPTPSRQGIRIPSRAMDPDRCTSGGTRCVKSWWLGGLHLHDDTDPDRLDFQPKMGQKANLCKLEPSSPVGSNGKNGGGPVVECHLHTIMKL